MSDWSSGLFGCFENVGICFKAFFCPCIVAGQIGEALGESCFWHCFASTLWLPGVLNGAENRGKLRAMYQIPVYWAFGLNQVHDLMKSSGYSIMSESCVDNEQ